MSKQKPPQEQSSQPGIESEMHPKPKYQDPDYKGSDKLLDKVAVITGGDSGIGRAVAVAFAIEGADVVFTYFDEHEDAEKTKKAVESKGRKCLTFPGDIKDYNFCHYVVNQTVEQFGKIDILVNNAAVQFPQDNFEDISIDQLHTTFATNIFSYFYMIKSALEHMKKGSCIINTSSVVAYRGSHHLIDYSATKGAIVALTRSLSSNLLKNKREIRVNGVAPGPIWTPLIPASFTEEEVAKFGSKTPMKRAGEPKEVAPCYVFLASEDASYITGQFLHPNGGEIVNS